MDYERWYVEMTGYGNYSIFKKEKERAIYFAGAINREAAHLIAAAPKMLEALENLENDNNQIPEHAWEMVQNAIKSARNK